MARQINFGLWYDFRNPPRWQVPFERLYSESLDQIVEAERLGFDSVWITEHHFCDDGYTPSPLVMGAAIGGRTKRPCCTNRRQLPFDRFRWSRRVSRQSAQTRSLARGWRDHRRQLAIVSDDPEREARAVGPHALYQGNQYIEWGAFRPPDTTPRFPDAATALAQGPYQLWGADQAVAGIAQLLRHYPQIRDLHFWARLPGEAVSVGHRRVEYMAKHVLPRVRAALVSCRGPRVTGVTHPNTAPEVVST